MDLRSEVAVPPKKYFTDRDPRELTVDHIVPLARGGKSTPSNLAAACRGCNSRKHSKTAEEFFVYEMQRHHVLRRALLQRQERAFAT